MGGKNKRLGISLEAGILLLLFFFLLYISLGGISDHQIRHTYPTGHLSSDSYQHYTWSEWIKTKGNYRYGPPSLYAGKLDVVGHYPFMHSTLSALISWVSGEETYDTLLILSYMFAVLAGLVMYFIIKRINKLMAILSLPLFIFLFTLEFRFIFLWGQYAMLIANFFAVLMFWTVSRTELRYWWVLFGIATAASFHAHAPEMIIAYGFCIAYCALRAILDKQIRVVFDFIKGSVLFVVLSFNYIIILVFGMREYSGFKAPLIDLANPITEYLAPHTAAFGQFGIAAYVIAAGMIIGIALLFTKRARTGILISIYMMIIGYVNYLGGKLGGKTLQQRFYWAVFLAPVFGLALYHLVSFLLKRVRVKFKSFHAAIVSLALVILFFSVYFHPPINSGSLFMQETWDAVKWIRENTNENDKIFLFFNRLTFQESTLATTLRHTLYIPFPGEIDKKILEKNLTRYYSISDPIETAYLIPYRKGLFSFGHHMKEFNEKTGLYLKKHYRDICSFNYYVLFTYTEVPQFQPYMEYSYLLANELIKSGYFEIVQQNKMMTIMKNNNPGTECISADGIIIEGEKVA